MAASFSSLSFFSSTIFLTSSSNKVPKPIQLAKPNSLINLPPKPLIVSSQLASPLPILSFTGEKIGETYLDLKSAAPDTARAVVHRALITDMQNKRRGTASTLTRGEVRGGGRKPYSQKKTGRARRGSNRTPLRPGGGVVFGPKPRDWSIKINKKEKRLAISTAIASAAAAENTIVVEEFDGKFERPKTKEFIEAMRRWGLDPKQKATFLVMEVSENVEKSSRNIGTLKMLTPRTLNLFDILDAETLVLTPSTVDFLNGRYGVEFEGDGDEEEEESEAAAAAAAAAFDCLYVALHVTSISVLDRQPVSHLFAFRS
ncbi:50S ribosomal protein L4 [Citrus sinensis]|nr:50S ribosomal protein L4 [Citrus sinensis]